MSEYDAAQTAVQAALDAGATYADARVMHRRSESMTARNGEVDSVSQDSDSGLGVRALVGSGWGFFAVPDLTDRAARDAGASRFEIVRFIVLPLCKTGIALGSIFVVSIVMGDFFVVKVMSGGGSASVVGAFYEDIGVLQYPTAAASATILTIIVLLLVVLILRTVDIRKELTR